MSRWMQELRGQLIDNEIYVMCGGLISHFTVIQRTTHGE